MISQNIYQDIVERNPVPHRIYQDHVKLVIVISKIRTRRRSRRIFERHMLKSVHGHVADYRVWSPARIVVWQPFQMRKGDNVGT